MVSGAVGLVVGHPLDTVKVSFFDNRFEVCVICWFSVTDTTNAVDAFILFIGALADPGCV